MVTSVFILPGNGEQAHERQYRWLRSFFTKKGYVVHTPRIHWKNHVLSQNARGFCQYYERYKTEVNVVVGFSFGAMIALLTNAENRPDKLVLCSLSPYFAEDLSNLRPSWRRMIGKRRFDDFKMLHAKVAERSVRVPTLIFCGTKEAASYPQLLRRTKSTSANIPGAMLIMVEGATHNIDDPIYVNAIKQELRNF